MKYEEAIGILTYQALVLERASGKSTLERSRIEALSKAVEAIEKQIPKKPLHMHKNYYCSICKEDGWMLWDDAIPNDMDGYCGKCGQAIDWSDCRTKMDLDI